MEQQPEPGHEGNEIELPSIPRTGNAPIVDRAEQCIAKLISGIAAKDDVLDALEVRKRLAEVSRALCKAVEESAIAWLQANGEIECGEIRYYAGIEKKTTCTNPKAATVAVLDAAGGDTDKFTECLASGAFKPGACKQLLGEQRFAELFKTEAVPDLKTGRAKTVLVAANPNFLPKRGAK